MRIKIIGGTGKSLKTRVNWVERNSRPGWDISYTHVGGSLPDENLSSLGPLEKESLRKIRSQTMFAISGTVSHEIDDDTKFLCAIALKAIQRGELPNLPRDVAASLKQLMAPIEFESYQDVLSAIANFESDEKLDMSIVLHDTYEKPFWNYVYETYPSLRKYLIPQASLENLASGSEPTRWIDFLWYSPFSPEAPVVLEIDGLHHEKAKLVDSARDLELFNSGKSVIRFATNDENSNWKTEIVKPINEASDVLKELSPNIGLAKSIFIPSAIARFQYGFVEFLLRGTFSSKNKLLIEMKSDLEIPVIPIIESLSFLLKLEEFWGLDVLPEKIILNENTYERQNCKYVQIDEIANPNCHVMFRFEFKSSSHSQLPNVNLPTCIFRNVYLPVDLEFRESPIVKRRILKEISENNFSLMQSLMSDFFGHENFRENQAESILSTLNGKDSLALLPTGSGKSLIYQMVGLLQPGTTIVVAPLVALINDQIRRLNNDGVERTLGLHAEAFRGPNKKVEAYRQLSKGSAHFLLIAPERLLNQEFRDSLANLVETYPVNCAVLDEAHCISEWGHDFRTAYLNVARNLRFLCQGNDDVPPTLLSLTGTASPAVLRDVLREISDPIRETIVIKPNSYDRKNLHYSIRTSSNQNLQSDLIGLLTDELPKKIGCSVEEIVFPNGLETNSGIVFVPFASDNNDRGLRRTRVRIHRALSSALPPEKMPTASDLVGYFSGKSPDKSSDSEWSIKKNKMASEFITNRLPILVATKAFGMGIDKPNIRWTAHIGFPSSLEGFAQEAGRAGRDGLNSFCSIITTPAEEEIAQVLLDLRKPVEMRKQSFQAYSRKSEGRSGNDLLSQLFFHFNSFAGVEVELREIEGIIKKFNFKPGAQFTIPEPSEKEKNAFEKALYRLSLAGIIDEFTISSKQYDIRLAYFDNNSIDKATLDFLRRIEPGKTEFHRRAVVEAPSAFLDRLHSHLNLLVQSVYSTIEPARIRALREMQNLCTANIDSEGIRARIIAYLSGGPLANALEDVATATQIDVQAAIDDLQAIQNIDTDEWVGASQRQLESYPDNPILLSARAVGENASAVPDLEFMQEILDSAFANMPTYAIDEAEAAKMLRWLGERFQYQQARSIEPDIEALSNAWEKSGYSLEPLVEWEQEIIRKVVENGSSQWHGSIKRIVEKRMQRNISSAIGLVGRLKG